MDYLTKAEQELYCQIKHSMERAAEMKGRLHPVTINLSRALDELVVLATCRQLESWRKVS